MSLGAAWGISHLQVTSCNDSNVLVLPQSSATSHEIPKGARWECRVAAGTELGNAVELEEGPEFWQWAAWLSPRARSLPPAANKTGKEDPAKHSCARCSRSFS